MPGHVQEQRSLMYDFIFTKRKRLHTWNKILTANTIALTVNKTRPASCKQMHNLDKPMQNQDHARDQNSTVLADLGFNKYFYHKRSVKDQWDFISNNREFFCAGSIMSGGFTGAQVFEFYTNLILDISTW